MIYAICEKKKKGIERIEEFMNLQFKIILIRNVNRAKNLNNVISILKFRRAIFGSHTGRLQFCPN